MPSRVFVAPAGRARARRVATAMLPVVAAAVLGSCAVGSQPAAPTTIPAGVDRVVDVDMLDIRFEPAVLELEAGSTVAFRFVNRGRIVHEAFVDGRSGQGVELGPGKGGLLVRRFDRPGLVVIGCYEPGHFEAGMRIDVTVR